MVASLCHREPQPSDSNASVPRFLFAFDFVMELALEAVKNMNILFYEEHMHTEVTQQGVTLEELPLVPATRAKRAYKEFFQVVANISHADLQSIKDAFAEGQLRISTLPVSVRPRTARADSCRLQLVVEETADGQLQALKFFHSTVDIPWGLVRTLCEDSPRMINYRVASNSHLVKMAFLKMLGAIRGHQWLTQGLQEKLGRGGPGRVPGAENKWDPTEEDLRAGMTYINLNAPLSNSKNEQYLWVLLQVRDAASPIHGWPEHVVLRACQNRTTGNSQAEPEWFFPLLLDDLNSEFLAKVVPKIVPGLTSFGLMILGKAGIGKTPVAQVLCMAVARHIIESRSLESVAGVRKAKQIDGFRERPGEVHVPVILDDPNLASINLEDLKSFLDVGENSLVDARYRAAKFMRNQCRVILNNEWDDTKEPSDAFLDTITWDQFKGMFLTACQFPKVPHLMAILKRTTVIIAGHHGVYVRLPSEHTTEPVHRFSSGGITEDWLKDTNKEYYGLYKQGIHQKYPNFERNLDAEQELMAYLLGTPEEKEYIRRANLREQWRSEWDAAALSEPFPSLSAAPSEPFPSPSPAPAELVPSPAPPYQAAEGPPSPQASSAAYPAGRPKVESPERSITKEEPVLKRPRSTESEVIDVDEEFPATPPERPSAVRTDLQLLDDDDDSAEEDVFQHGPMV